MAPAAGLTPGNPLPWWQRPGLLAPLLVAVLFLPFVGKALHIDDIAFIRLGESLGWNPLVAEATDVFYQGILWHDVLPYDSTHPLLLPWLLKLLRIMAGENEAVLHLAFLPFPLLALWGLGRLGNLLLPGPARTSLLLVLFATTPAFLVNGHNLMTDVPTLSFLVAGFALLLEGALRNERWRLWLGSTSLTFALFMSYQAALLIPALLPLCRGLKAERRLARSYLLALALPLVLLVIWLMLVYQRYEIFPFLAARSGVNLAAEVKNGWQWLGLAEKVVYLCAFLGAAMLPVLVVAGRGWAEVRRYWPILMALAVMLLPTMSWLPGAKLLGWPHWCLLCVLTLLGVAALCTAGAQALALLAESNRRATTLFLVLWLGIVLLYNVLFLPFGAARYLLPALPPLFLLLLGDTAARRTQMPAWLINGCLVATTGFGILAACSDYALAGCYRTMAREVEQVRTQGEGRSDVWYVGEWGMRHYFDLAGARYLPAESDSPRPGDLVVIPEMPRFWVPSPALQRRLQPWATREFVSPLPLRLFNRRSGAGFYGHHWGLLPFAISGEPDEVFAVMQVGALEGGQ